VTTPSALSRALISARPEQIAERAANGLARTAPHLSYREGLTAGQAWFAAALAAGLSLATLEAPGATWLCVTTALGLALLAATSLRIAAASEPIPIEPPPERQRLPDRDLPVYTILVPLFREGAVLPKLVAALSALDYPAAKLQILLLLESDDVQTRDALARLKLPAFFDVIVVPPGQPRTKPRALNVGLDIAQGEHVVVYDAEDVPDPGQLRLAVSYFARSEPDVACLQARLAIDNTQDTWLTRLFTVEYAALFDVVNPALAVFDLPIALGGTSNHFRTALLRDLGGWDAWNVTEDADLGMRLAGAGYRVCDLPSVTMEEAPRRLSPWIKQRTRWMKGLLQVWITHSRRPVSGFRQLGPTRMLAAAILSFGTVASAAVFPFFTIYAGHQILSGRYLESSTALEVASTAVGTTLFASGVLAVLLPPLVALSRRRTWSLLPLVPLMPLYYLLVSVGAWRGIVELLIDPDRWHKTEHGLATTSRALTDSAAIRPPPRLAAVAH
jgi:cellulose synthase/poly-beta-1,6-N-acetylglucosamine synthase-like glycosyltransferase